MILRLFLLTYILYVTPALCRMTAQEFEDNIDKLCFREKADLIHGQENPLPNTLENFIALAEKFEIINPTMEFKDELFYFLRHYVFENIEPTKNSIGQWKPSTADMYEIERMWEPDARNLDQMNFQDDFTEDEKCSLYFMLSHAILDKPTDMPAQYRSAGNFSYDVISSRNGIASRNGIVSRNNMDHEEFYPQEIGVVAIRGTDAAVSLSRVLYGMYVGLKPDRQVEILSYNNVNRRFATVIQPGTTIDKLYALTLAEVVALSGWSLSFKKGFAPNGQWKSLTLDGYSDISDFCPLIYKQDSAQNAFSYSTVRGAADGLILGSVVSDIITKKSRTRLSQMLRMYYSRDGVPVEQGSIEMNPIPRASFCNRFDIVDKLEKTLFEQTGLYYYMVAERLGVKNESYDNAIRQYTQHKRDIYEMSNTELHDYCSMVPTLEQPENLPRENFLDVLVVMDSSTSEDAFRKQQKITGLLAKNLELRYTGSRMTILLDQRITTYAAASGRIELKPVVEDTFSSGCAACMVGQISYERAQMEDEQVIQAIDQYLQERKDNETEFNGVNGKVVVYYNFEEDDMNRGGNNKIQGSLNKAIANLHLHHPDVLLFAVGLNEVLLRKFVKNDKALVGSAGIPEEEVAKKLYKRIVDAPAQIKYPDCKFARSESFAIYENFVSPNAVQHWTIPPENFYKSINLKVSFESRNGIINVCHNRATMKPEEESKNCNSTLSGNRVEFKLPNPCKGFDQYSCAPFYFAVMGKPADNSASNRVRTYCEDTKEHWCRTLDQIKFTVSHEGMRCSGSIGLRSLPAIIIFTLIFLYILHKGF